MADCLFDVMIGAQWCDGPRDATAKEMDFYLAALAEARGIFVPMDATFDAAGIFHDGRLILEMPGHGVSELVTCELLDEAGAVVSTIKLPPNAKGALPMTAAKAKDWTGLQPVKKPRAPRAAAPVDKPAENSAPVAPAPVSDAPAADLVALVASLEARLAALESAKGYSPPPVPANDAAAPVGRSEREKAAIRRAWAMRREMRERRDLDARALEAANGAYRGSLDVIERINADLVQSRATVSTLEAAAVDYAATITAQRAQLAGQDRTIGRLSGEVRAAGARADRLLTIATAKRRYASTAAAQLAQAAADLAGAKAETRAYQRRYSTLKDALASTPTAAAVIGRKFPTALIEA